MSPAKKKRKSRKGRAKGKSAVTGNRPTGPVAAANPRRPSGDLGLRLVLRAVDTWFFRESRPHNGVGASELASIFPPPVATLAGALRSAVGDARGTDWHRFAVEADHPLREQIGFGDDLGPLRFDGPWLQFDGATLFPVPAFLLAGGDSAPPRFRRLCLGPPADTDMGRVHLPRLPDQARDCKPLDDCWLDASGLQRLLDGGLPQAAQLYRRRDLYHEEPRLGIGRDPHSGTVETGMLYQTRHLRPHPALTVDLGVSGLADDHRPPDGTLLRLGGEGRLASVTAREGEDPLARLRPDPGRGQGRRIILLLLTPADLGGRWLPPGFEADSPRDGEAVSWRGTLHGIRLRIRGAALGRARRQGGWDQAAGKPRPVRSLLPAGSAWYCEIDPRHELQHAIDSLHGRQLQNADDYHQCLGHGRLAVALWPASEQPEQEQTP